MEELTTRTDYVKATMADGICLLEATAPWCTQCKAIAPFLNTLMTKYPNIRYYYYNTDTADDIAHELGANVMPTFHLFKDGDLVGGVTGAKGSELEKMLEENYE